MIVQTMPLYNVGFYGAQNKLEDKSRAEETQRTRPSSVAIPMLNIETKVVNSPKVVNS